MIQRKSRQCEVHTIVVIERRRCARRINDPSEGSISNLPPFIWVRYHSSLKTFCRLTKCSNPEPCACLMINEDFTLQIDEFFSIERKSIIQDFSSKAFYWFTAHWRLDWDFIYQDFKFIKVLSFQRWIQRNDKFCKIILVLNKCQSKEKILRCFSPSGNDSFLNSNF
jgi:hypothetical protein